MTGDEDMMGWTKKSCNILGGRVQSALGSHTNQRVKSPCVPPEPWSSWSWLPSVKSPTLFCPIWHPAEDRTLHPARMGPVSP